MLNEMRMIFLTIGTVMIGILTAVYFKMDAEFRAKPLHKLYTLIVYEYLKICVMSVRGVDYLRRKFWFGAGVYEPDAERMAELQRKEARMYQMRLQMQSSSSGYKNYHQYNMRRMK